MYTIYNACFNFVIQGALYDIKITDWRTHYLTKSQPISNTIVTSSLCWPTQVAIVMQAYTFVDTSIDRKRRSRLGLPQVARVMRHFCKQQHSFGCDWLAQHERLVCSTAECAIFQTVAAAAASPTTCNTSASLWICHCCWSVNVICRIDVVPGNGIQPLWWFRHSKHSSIRADSQK